MVAPAVPDDCLQQLPVLGHQLADGDELSQHRAVRSLIACEAQAPVAFAAAPGLEAVARGISQSSIARDRLSAELDRLGPSLGGALLAATLLPAVDPLVAAQRWYVQAGLSGTVQAELDGAFAEQVAGAVRRAADNALIRESGLAGGERRDALFAAESLYNQVLRESGVAMVPPPETLAQAKIREVCGVTLAELRDKMAARGESIERF